jgi:hypothetical protein
VDELLELLRGLLRAEKVEWANELLCSVHLSFVGCSLLLWIRPYPLYVMGGAAYKAVLVSSLRSTSARVHGGLAPRVMHH